MFDLTLPFILLNCDIVFFNRFAELLSDVKLNVCVDFLAFVQWIWHTKILIPVWERPWNSSPALSINTLLSFHQGKVSGVFCLFW